MTSIISPKTSKRLPVYVEEEELNTLFEYVEFPDNWQGRTERLVMQLFYQTGMRLSELIQLKESQLDIAGKQIKVLGKGNKERIIPVDRDFLLELQKYVDEKPVSLPICKTYLYQIKGNPYNQGLYMLLCTNTWVR
jgi:integrase/recombinase XerC